jgi:hypothetical protein
MKLQYSLEVIKNSRLNTLEGCRSTKNAINSIAKALDLKYMSIKGMKTIFAYYIVDNILYLLDSTTIDNYEKYENLEEREKESSITKNLQETLEVIRKKNLLTGVEKIIYMDSVGFVDEIKFDNDDIRIVPGNQQLWMQFKKSIRAIVK